MAAAAAASWHILAAFSHIKRGWFGGRFAAFCALHLYLDFAVGNIFRLFSAFAIAEYAKNGGWSDRGGGRRADDLLP